MKLIYSTGNYIQYLIITYNEKESEKKNDTNELICETEIDPQR